jgi:hypothetical protein
VFATANVRHLRHLLPSLGVLALFAGYMVARLRERSAVAATAVMVLALAPPLAETLGYLGRITRPGTLDQAADWIESTLPPGSRILATAAARIGLDRSRFEILRLDRLDPAHLPLAAEMDMVVAGSGDDRAAMLGLERRAQFVPEHRDFGPRVLLLAPPAAARPRYERIPLGGAELRAAVSPQDVDLVRDGDPETAWIAPPAVDAWIEVRLPAPSRLGRVELALGHRTDADAERLELWLGDEGSRWKRVGFLSGRPPARQQVGARPSDVLVFEPTLADRLRLVRAAPARCAWAIGELWLEEAEVHTSSTGITQHVHRTSTSDPQWQR